MSSRRSVAEVATGAAVIVVALAFLVYALVSTGRATASGLRLVAQFTNVGGISAGSDVRIAGVKVGAVSGIGIDPVSFQAVVQMVVRADLKLPTDSSATISTGGLLGGQFISLAPGGSEKDIADGGQITITQSATNLEDLLGKFIFNVGSLADATQRSLQQHGEAPGK